MKPKAINVADNSGTRRRNAVLKIWRNDIAGMDPGSVVFVRFTDEYTHNHIEKVTPRKYVVVDIKFDDDYARQRGRHTVTLRKEKKAEMEKNSRRDAERQRAQSGNAAKLLEAVRSLMDNLKIHLLQPIEQITINRAELEAMIKDCSEALAEPARNCDWCPTWESAKAAYWREQGDPADWRKLGAWLFAAKEEERGEGSPRTEQESEVAG